MLRIKIIIFGTTEDGEEIFKNHTSERLKDIDGIEGFKELEKRFKRL
jgi:hypothetical protein